MDEGRIRVEVVFAKPGEVYAIYLPGTESTGSLDLSGVSGQFEKRWFDPRTGEFVGTAETVSGDVEVEANVQQADLSSVSGDVAFTGSSSRTTAVSPLTALGWPG